MPTKLVPPPIENFDKLIEPHLNGEKLVSYDSEYFTVPGDNYGSTIFKVIAKIRRNASITYNLYLIIKLLPANELMFQIFEPERSFRTEQCCYTTVAPALVNLQLEAGIADKELTNIFAKCFGSRISMNENAKQVDSDAALIFEDLTVSGYRMIDRLQGCDLEATRIVLRDLARFHAMIVAFRMKFPAKFDKDFRPYFKPFDLDGNHPDDLMKQLTEDNLAIMKTLPNIGEGICKKIEKNYLECLAYASKKDERPDGPFSTITHYDLWCNNFMIRYDENNQPQDMKMIDFQVAQYDSLVHDLVFLIFTSVQIDIVRTKLDFLFKEYYDQFVNWLATLGCSTNGYSFTLFEKELIKVAPLQFKHITAMLRFVLRKKDALPNAEEMDDKTALDRNLIHTSYFDRMRDTILIFEKRGFLQ